MPRRSRGCSSMTARGGGWRPRRSNAAPPTAGRRSWTRSPRSMSKRSIATPLRQRWSTRPSRTRRCRSRDGAVASKLSRPACPFSSQDRAMMLPLLDRYLLRRAAAPMSAVLISTMVAFLTERLMRSFQLLSQTTEGFKFLTELLVNLVPHYVGLTLPGGFFIGLFVVINSLNKSSEIDAVLASGVSLGRFAAPLVGLGIVLMLFSVALFGFIQPYS